MHKFSVKKPLTVFVAVIAILVMGVVAYFKMTPDLLPNMDFPYVLIVTTYPGASPEKVESVVTKPMEQSMSTLDHILEVTSTSSENVSTVILEFEESVNMDTIGVDIQQQIATLRSGWEDMVGTPYVLKINPSMLPVEVAAVSMEGMDTIELTEFLNDTLMNKLEGIAGVARISTTGMIEQELHVILDQDLIDQVNARIAQSINDKLDEAAQGLADQKAELEQNRDDMNAAQSQLSAGANAIIQGQNQLETQRTELQNALSQIETALLPLYAATETLEFLNSQVEFVVGQQNDAYARLHTLEALVSQGEAVKLTQAAVEALREEVRLLQEQGDDGSLANKQALLIQMEGELAQEQSAYAVALAAAWVTEDTLDVAIDIARANCVIADEAVEAVDVLLEASGTDRAGLASVTAETAAQLQQVLDAKAQIEQGLVTIDQAEKMLEEQKLTGMLQLSTAAAQLTAGAASIEMALVQIDSGLTQIEDSRASALDQADLNNIITMEMVTQILAAQNFSMPAGYVEEDGVNYMVSIGDEIRQLSTLQDLLLLDMGMEGIDPIYLRDVAVITVTDNRDETYARLDGQDSVMLSFEKQSTYATAQTTANIAEKFRDLEEAFPGLKFVALMDQGDYIYMVVESILSNLFLGAVFSVLVLVVFLRDIRPTLITLVSIPISVIFAIVLMYFSGVTLNMISLSGLAISVGMLVDNSIVVIENIYRLRAKGANVIQAAVSGAGQVFGSVCASTLTTICVFVPIVFVEGITKQLFTDLALTMSYSLLASLAISLTLVPAMATGMLKKEHVPHEGFLEKRIIPLYQKALGWSLNHKLPVLAVAMAALILSMIIALAGGFIFMPTMDSPNVTVSVTMPEGVDMEGAVERADQVLDRIAGVPGIKTAGAMMGSSGGALMGMGGGGGSFNVTVYVLLENEKDSGAAVGRAIEEACEGLDCTVSASSAMIDMSILTGSGVSVRLYGEDMEELQNAAVRTAEAFAAIDGVGQVSNGLEDAAPALHVAIDRNEAMRHGLTIAQVYMELAAGLTTSGNVTTLELDGISTDVIIEKPEGAVLNAQELRDYVFEVTGQDGTVKEVPLSDFAVVEETSSLASINRINQKRYLTVTAYLEPGYNVTLVTADAQDALARADLGDGVDYVFSGENESIMEAMEQLLLMLVLGMLLVYLIMVAQFQSLKSPFIVMFTIPLAFTGGFLALLLCGMEVSVISMIGFVMLVGVIVNNGIVLVDYINQLRMDGAACRDAIIEAGITRMRPILMTTLTTILGQLVMAVSQDVSAALMRPISVVSIGGLTYATIMTLFVVPCIYEMTNKKDLRVIDDKDLEMLDL
ncbi:MAG: efflux RND transporter permease subunit [Oscillospiraceae bacterium]|nr:efflux RND transporter permease subunit [Oscillospiraceae bacterium]